MSFEQLKKEDIDIALKVIEKDVERAPYIYVDLLKYGIDNPNVEFFIHKTNDGVGGIMMKYFNGLQIFTNTDSLEITDGINGFVREHDDGITIIAGDKETLDRLEIDREIYDYTETYIVERFKYKYEKLPQYEIKIATESDLDRLADFYIADAYYQDGYSREELYAQMKERMETNFGRVFYIEEKGRIICATQVMADTEKIAMSGLVLVDTAYRGKGLAAYIIGHVTDVIMDEGKRFFGIFHNMKGAQKYIDLGAVLRVTMAKLLKKRGTF